MNSDDPERRRNIRGRFDPRRQRGVAGFIDVHHHVMPPRYVAARSKYAIRTGPGFERAMQWTPTASIEQMDRNGIATAVLSNPSNWAQFPANEVPRLARDSNEFAVDARRDHPGRFGVFASLPMPDVEATLREIEYSMDVLNADGISTTTSFGDRWPGDPSFDEVFSELNRRRAVVFVHPQVANALSNLTPPVPDATVEFMFDIVRCITSMLFRGTFNRFPDIRFIFTHAGGGLAALADRIDRSTRYQPAVADQLPEGGMAELKRLYFDVTTTSSPAVAALQALVPLSQLLLGTDYPFMSPEATLAGLEAGGFDPAARPLICRGNAEALFPQFAQSGGWPVNATRSERR